MEILAYLFFGWAKKNLPLARPADRWKWGPASTTAEVDSEAASQVCQTMGQLYNTIKTRQLTRGGYLQLIQPCILVQTS